MARRPRADAQRNRALLLAAAREVFDSQGAEAALDEVARRAGVGNATLYRHFPARRDLLIAVYAEEVDALCAQGDALLVAEDPLAALFEWLAAFVAHVAAKRDLVFAIPADVHRTALFDRWHTAMRSTVSALVERAQHAGAARADLHAADLLTLANGIALAATGDAQTGRLLALARHGVVA
jgi:AcrR family transcriptional regulator